MKSSRIVLVDNELTLKELEIKSEFEQLAANCREDRRANTYAGPLEKYLQRHYIKKINNQNNQNLPKRYIQYLKNNGITFSPIYKNSNSQRYTSVELIRDSDRKIICEYKSKTKYRPRANKKSGQVLFGHHETFQPGTAFVLNLEYQQEVNVSRLLSEEELTVNEKTIINHFVEMIIKFREHRGHLSLDRYIEKYFPHFRKELKIGGITYQAIKNNPNSRQVTKIKLIRNSDESILYEYAMGSKKNVKGNTNDTGGGKMNQTKKVDIKIQNQKIVKSSKPSDRMLSHKQESKITPSNNFKNTKMKASEKTEGQQAVNKKTFFNNPDNDALMVEVQSVPTS